MKFRFKPHKNGQFKVSGLFHLFPNTGIDGTVIVDKKLGTRIGFYDLGSNYEIPFQFESGNHAEIRFAIRDDSDLYKTFMSFKRREKSCLMLPPKDYKIHKIIKIENAS